MNLSIPNTKRKAKNSMSRRERMFLHKFLIIDSHAKVISLISDFFTIVSDVGMATNCRVYLASTLPQTNRQAFDIWIHRAGLKQIVMVTGRLSTFDDLPDERPNFAVQTVTGIEWLDSANAEFMTLLDAFSVLSDAHMYINLPKGEHGQYILGEAPIERVVVNAIQFINSKAASNG